MRNYFSAILLITACFISFKVLAQPEALLGSNWAKEHPNMLPYSNCVLGSALSSTPNSNFEMSFIGGYEAAEGNIFYLSCTTVPFGEYPKGLGFQIPLGPLSSVKLGLMASISCGARNNFCPIFSLSHLNGKHYRDIFTIFDGGEASFHLLGGYSHGLMKNVHGIWLEKKMYGIGLGITLGFTDLIIKPFSQENFISNMCTNHYVLLEDTVSTWTRTSEECTKMSTRAALGETLFPSHEDKYRPGGVHLLPLDADLTFIEIK